MGTKATSRGLCCVSGRYRRTIGKFINGEGKVAPRKFLLGTDLRAAEIANLRLEQLWREVVEATGKDNTEQLRGWESRKDDGVEHLQGVSLVGGQPVFDRDRPLEWRKREEARPVERLSVEPVGNQFVLLSQRGQPMAEQRIANQWNKLLDRVTADHPKFRRLPFKFLRKTSGQLIRNVADGETMGVFLCHGQPVRTDDLADVYSNRDFRKVASALERVRQQLDPMFSAVADAFTQPRKKGGPNISRGRIHEIRKLQAEGHKAAEIIKVTGLARATVYRHLSAHTDPG